MAVCVIATPIDEPAKTKIDDKKADSKSNAGVLLPVVDQSKSVKPQHKRDTSTAQKPNDKTTEKNKDDLNRASEPKPRPARDAPAADNSKAGKKDQKDQKHRYVRQINEDQPNNPRNPQGKQPVPALKAKREVGINNPDIPVLFGQTPKTTAPPADQHSTATVVNDHKIHTRDTDKDNKASKNGDKPKRSGQNNQRQQKQGAQQKSGPKQKQ